MKYYSNPSFSVKPTPVLPSVASPLPEAQERLVQAICDAVCGVLTEADGRLVRFPTTMTVGQAYATYHDIRGITYQPMPYPNPLLPAIPPASSPQIMPPVNQSKHTPKMPEPPKHKPEMTLTVACIERVLKQHPLTRKRANGNTACWKRPTSASGKCAACNGMRYVSANMNGTLGDFEPIPCPDCNRQGLLQ